MKNTKKLLNICFIAIVLGLLMIITGCRETNANRHLIQYSDIEKVYIWMPFDSVVSVLGMPYTFSSDLGDHDLSCKYPRDVSNIKMTTKTDFVQFIDTVFQDTNYCCVTNRKNMKVIEKHSTLTYTEEPSFFKSIFNSPMFTYPMLWIHLDNCYRVSSVYAKYYGKGWDEKCMYLLSENSDKDSQDDHIGLFEDSTLFRKCFPSADAFRNAEE